MNGARTYRLAVQDGDAFLIPGDIHFPVHDKAATRAVWEWWAVRVDAGFFGRAGVILLRTHALSSRSSMDVSPISRRGAAARTS